MIYLKLATPFNPGAYDAGNTYPHAVLTLFNLDTMQGVIELRWEYGTFDTSSGWSTGKGSITQIAHIQNEDFAEAMQTMPENSSDSVLLAAARASYEYLIAKDLADGTIEEAFVQPPAEQPEASATGATGATGADSSSATGATGATGQDSASATGATADSSSDDSGATASGS